MAKFGKSYQTEQEYFSKKSIYTGYDAKIKAHNSRTDQNYQLSHNKFSTWTAEEYQKLLGYGGAVGELHAPKREEHPEALGATSVPESFDWVTGGAVSSVKDQGSCGSCWSFSSTAALESSHYILNGELYNLSQQ